jgi:hypothetical protein
MSDNYDPFKFDTGLKDDYDATIITEEFKQSDYGNFGLVLTVEADDEEVIELRPLGCGKDWRSVDGGETVEGPSAKSRYHASAGISAFIAAAMKCGAEDELRRRSNEEFDGRVPFCAGLWHGLRFHWDVLEEKANRQNRETKEWEEVVVNVVRPTKYLGTASASPAVSTTPSARSVTTTGAPSNGAATSIHPTDLAALTALATQHPFMEWVDKAMMLKGVDGELLLRNNAVKAMLSSEEQYNSLRG